jgi:small subunit ribosomal protein S8
MQQYSIGKRYVDEILKEEGFIGDYEVVKGKPERVLKIHLKYDASNQPIISGLERVSKPG